MWIVWNCGRRRSTRRSIDHDSTRIRSPALISLSLSCKRSWHFIIHARAPFKARGNVNSKSLNLFGQFSPHRAQRAEQNISRDGQKTCRKLFEKGREKCAHDAFQLGLGRIWSNNVRTLSLASAKLYLHRETCDYFVFFFFSKPQGTSSASCCGSKRVNKVLQLLRASFDRFMRST